VVLGLFGGAPVEIEVSFPGGPYLAGRSVQATVSLKADKAFKVKEVRGALIMRERYQKTEEYRDNDGDRQTRDVWVTDEQVICQSRLEGGQTIQGGFARQYPFQCQIPDNPPPPGDGAISTLHWLVKVTVDRPMARDANVEVPVPVVVPAPGRWTQEGRYGESSDPGIGSLWLMLPSLELVAGEQVRGRFSVLPNGAHSVRAVRVELSRDERVTAGDTNNDRHTAEVVVQLAGQTTFTPGVQADYDFVLDIPAGVCPSRRTGHASVRWTLKGILDRQLKSDYRAEQEVLVANWRGAAPDGSPRSSGSAGVPHA
jgi:hypothetical protein